MATIETPLLAFWRALNLILQDAGQPWAIAYEVHRAYREGLATPAEAFASIQAMRAGRSNRPYAALVPPRSPRSVALHLGRIDKAMQDRYSALGSDVCEWARVMASAARAALPAVLHDRLRAAAEFRLAMAHELRHAETTGVDRR